LKGLFLKTGGGEGTARSMGDNGGKLAGRNKEKFPSARTGSR